MSPGKPTRPWLRDAKEFGLKAIKMSIKKLENFCDSSVLDDEGKIV